MQANTNNLRRLALARQGLTRPAAFGRGRPGAHRALEHLGYVQIDTISVVARAHNHTLWARVPNFRPEHIDAMVRRREAFEYWFHAAAYLPMRDYRFSLLRKHAIKSGERHWYRSRDEKLMKRILDQIAAEGGVRARDFENPTQRNTGWWDWKPAKRALEQLFMQGDLMISAREGFQKVYDLPERVLPDDIDDRTPSASEFAGHLIDVNLASHGFATRKSFSYGRRGKPLRVAIDTVLKQRCEAGELVSLKLPDGQTIFGSPDEVGSAQRKPLAQVRLLSPFDNAIIQRDRNQAVHEFDYQLECYVTASKRQYGYYCLPILYRDRFVGRVDCKAHRREGRFEVIRLHIESEPDEPDRFAEAFSNVLKEYAAFNDCTSIDLGTAQSKNWSARLKPLLEGD
jgi:uncharacterized protein YcaQ